MHRGQQPRMAQDFSYSRYRDLYSRQIECKLVRVKKCTLSLEGNASWYLWILYHHLSELWESEVSSCTFETVEHLNKERCPSSPRFLIVQWSIGQLSILYIDTLMTLVGFVNRRGKKDEPESLLADDTPQSSCRFPTIRLISLVGSRAELGGLLFWPRRQPLARTGGVLCELFFLFDS